jgi:hypothetical protein
VLTPGILYKSGLEGKLPMLVRLLTQQKLQHSLMQISRATT